MQERLHVDKQSQCCSYMPICILTNVLHTSVFMKSTISASPKSEVYQPQHRHHPQCRGGKSSSCRSMRV